MTASSAANRGQPGDDCLHPACVPIEILLADCTIQHLKRSGPGGQRRNKVETCVLIHHQPTNLTGEASERRSIAENLPFAIHRLRLNLAMEVRSQKLADRSPTGLWKSRCPNGRIVVNEKHFDFPALLAETLDVLQDRGFHVVPVAERLGCSTSQLMKFLQKEPRAWKRLNDERTRMGLPILKSAS